MILYLDTSALVKRYVRERGTGDVIVLIEQADVVGSLALARVEMASTLAKSVRQNWVEHKAALQAWQDFLEHWLSFTRLSIVPSTLERASKLAWEYGLRGYDAMHLAAALIWQETLETSVTLATFDRDLWQATQKVGMHTWPEGLYS